MIETTKAKANGNGLAVAPLRRRTAREIKMKAIGISLPEELEALLQRASRDHFVTRNAILVRACAEWLASNGYKEQ